jgi:predicted phosphodiesterase
MKYAIVSDIHGNITAFEAVLADIANKNVDSIIFLGDYIQDLPWANEVLDLIRSMNNIFTVRGNKEDYLKELEKMDRDTWIFDQHAPVYWGYGELSKANLEYLHSLPERMTISNEARNIFLTHAPQTFFGISPVEALGAFKYVSIIAENPEFTHEDYLRYAKNILQNDKEFLERLDKMPNGIYLFGHYHSQWYAEINEKLLINPGSCGVPLDNDTRASYTILDCEGMECEVEERRVSYDIEHVIREYKKSELYKTAEIVGRINIMHLNMGLVYLNNFLRYVDDMANELGDESRPYSNELWRSAGETWLKENE